MAFESPRILSRPVRLNWAGWETDTHRLQQHGWSISAEQDMSRMEMAIALRAPHGEAYGISTRVPWQYMEDDRRYGMGLDSIQLPASIRFGKDVAIHHMGSPMAYGSSWAAVDAMPQLATSQITRLEDYAHFAPSPLVRNNPIVVPEENVQELMERILKLQQPDRTARIQAALRDPHGYDASSMPAQKFHAQIISFGRAA